MQVVLVMFRGEGERRSFSITRDVTVVGRREDCDFRIPLGEISRKHCRLMKDGDVLKVEDLGSSNGTFHNGERVQACELAPGDTLQVGSVAFVVQIDGTPADDEMQPVTAGSRRTAAPMGEEDDLVTQEDATLQDAGGSSHGGNGASNGHGEFDPMSVLEADASGQLPEIDHADLSDDSAINDDVVIDLAENSAEHDAASDRA